MKVTVTVKSVYGTRMIYPACDISKELCLHGVKTLTQAIVQSLKLLGYSIEQTVERIDI